jgi:hypothetical protein
MLAELDTKTQLNIPPPQWMWWENAGPAKVVTAASVAGTDVDFWHIPWRGPTAPAPALRNPDSLDAPGQVGVDSDTIRNGSRQILNTQIAMSMLLNLPANRTTLQKLAPNQFFTPTWVGNLDVPTPGSDGVLNTTDDGANEQVTDFYLSGEIVQLNGIQFLCNSTTTPVTATPAQGSNGPPWKDLTLPANSGMPTTPMLLDAWNNPIIFVPATGLRVRLLNGQSSLNADEVADQYKQTFIIISPEGKVDRDPATHEPIVIQPGRPFFASAGPDGDFSKGDDNVYSFQQ